MSANHVAQTNRAPPPQPSPPRAQSSAAMWHPRRSARHRPTEPAAGPRDPSIPAALLSPRRPHRSPAPPPSSAAPPPLCQCRSPPEARRASRRRPRPECLPGLARLDFAPPPPLRRPASRRSQPSTSVERSSAAASPRIRDFSGPKDLFNNPGPGLLMSVGPNQSTADGRQGKEEPTVELFRDFFYLNRHTEFTDGPNTELGGDDDPFWKKKSQDKPAKTPRVKTKVTKKPAKKKNAEPSEPLVDDDLDNPDSEDDVEGSQADDVEGTPHSSSRESMATQLPTLKTVPGAKPRPIKKARLNKLADDNVVIELEKTPDPEETNADAMLDDPPPQDYDFVVEQVEVDPTGHANKTTSPV
nr:serine/arginine repetitive matrix protein 1-like [Aegilops tauschii subsp. strangulata]